MDLSTREGRRRQGERIKKAARDAGLTLDELARKINCSRALIFQYASGASLAQSDRLQQIASVVDKPLYWFFLEEGSNPQLPAEIQPDLKASLESLQSDRASFAAEQARFEQRRRLDDIAHLETLLAACGSPPDPRKVIDCCQQLTTLLYHDENTQKLAAIMLKQGNALIQLQEWGAAKEKLEQAGAIYRESGSLVYARDCMQSLGHVNLMLGRVEEALKQFEYVASGDDWSNRWQGTLSIGAAHETLGDYSSAIAAFERALEIVEASAEQPRSEFARLYIEANWANLELDFGDYRNALLRAQRCIRMAQSQCVQDQYIEALLTTGFAHLQLKELKFAVSYIQQALDVSDLIGDQQHRSLALSCLSFCDTELHRTTQAVAEGKEALALALRCSAVRAEIAAQRALAEAYLRSDNPSEALYHAQQGLQAAVNMRMRLPQAQFIDLKSRALLTTANFEEALSESEKAMAMANDLQSRPLQLECRTTSAFALLQLDSDQTAFALALDVIEKSAAYHLPDIEWKGHYILALVYSRRGDLPLARSSYEQAIALFEKVRSEFLSREGEDLATEERYAMKLWQDWLRFAVAAEGQEEARKRAAEADWPPLQEWLEHYLQTEGGLKDA